MSGTINTPVTGANGTIDTDGGPATETGMPFSNEDLAALGAQLVLVPRATGGVGGAGQGGTRGANGLAQFVEPTNPNNPSDLLSETVNYAPGGGGGPGANAGNGGPATITMANDTLGSAASPYGSSFQLQALATGGLGGTGGSGGSGGSSGYNESTTGTNPSDGTTYPITIAGAAGGGGGQGGDGGNGGAASASITNLQSDTTDGVTLTIAGIGGQGGGTLASSGGDGNYGGDTSAGGDGGAGGFGGNGSATFSGSSMLDQLSISVTLTAKGGAGGAGGTGGVGGAADYKSVTAPYNQYFYGTNGNGGAGGGGGMAQATMTGDSLTAPAVTVTLSAQGGLGGAGGVGGNEGPSGGNSLETVETDPQGTTGNVGGNGVGTLTMQNNTIKVGIPAIVGYAGQLTLSLAITEPGQTNAFVSLDGTTGGNLVFSGNNLVGAGASALDLQLFGSGTAVINTIADTLSLDGSPANTMTGFTSFDLDNNDTFYVGPGIYNEVYALDPDTTVYTPQSGSTTIQGVTAANLLLNFQGFGSSLTPQDVQNDTVVSNGNTIIRIPGAGSITLMGFTASIPTGDIEFTPLCFLAGTLIATPSGERPVEALAAGDLVTTHSGEARRIAWIGHGCVLATRGRRSAATPVIVRKGAVGPNVPHRDLHVTKGHSLFIDNVLIPVEFLVNHRSVEWDDRAQEVTMYHVELETHDILLANGAPAESYRDDGNRWLFHNANSGWGLPPKPPCAPVLTGGPIVDAAWRRLLDRAGPRPGLPLTDDADLHLLADGERLNASRRHGDVFVFALRSVPSALRIVSRAAAPQELGLVRDPRQLGVALRQIMVTQGRRVRTIEAEDHALSEGFHEFEVDLGIRWTNGDAVLPAALLVGLSGPMEVTLQIGGTTTYLDEGMVLRVA